MKLLDTTYLIHYQAGRDCALEYREENTNETFVTTTLNIKEYVVGYMSIFPDSTVVLHDIIEEFDWVEVVTYRSQFAYEAAVIEADLRSAEEYSQDLAGDILIGGAARDLRADVVTENVGDFANMVGVEVDSYAE